MVDASTNSVVSVLGELDKSEETNLGELDKSEETNHSDYMMTIVKEVTLPNTGELNKSYLLVSICFFMLILFILKKIRH